MIASTALFPTNAPPLTDVHRRDYADLGYCLVDGLYSSQELQDIEEFFQAWLEREDGHLEYFPAPGEKMIAQAKVRIEQIDRARQQVRALHPHRTDARAMGWFTHPKVVAALTDLLGSEPLGAQTMYYYKPPGACGQAMHQDNIYLLAQPEVCVGTWTPIDDADEENGCLLVVPGSHRLGLLCGDEGRKQFRLNAGGRISHFPDDRRPVPLPVRRGQTLIFDGRLIHGSGPNRSATRWRRTFIGHYATGTTEKLSGFYHPVVNMRGETVSRVGIETGGGPCGDSTWQGAVH